MASVIGTISNPKIKEIKKNWPFTEGSTFFLDRLDSSYIKIYPLLNYLNDYIRLIPNKKHLITLHHLKLSRSYDCLQMYRQFLD